MTAGLAASAHLINETPPICQYMFFILADPLVSLLESTLHLVYTKEYRWMIGALNDQQRVFVYCRLDVGCYSAMNVLLQRLSPLRAKLN